MPVYANSGPGLGEALLRGAQGFMQVRANKKADELFQQDMEDRFKERALKNAQLAQQGIHVLDPGELPPMWLPKANAEDITSRMAMPTVPDAELTFSPTGGAPTLQPKAGTGRAGIGAANIPGRPQGAGSPVPTAPAATGADLFQQTLAANLGGMPTRGPRFDVGKGYWIDKQPQWDAQDAASSAKMRDAFVPALVQQMVARGERDRQAGDYRAAGFTDSESAVAANNPGLAGAIFDRHNPKPPALSLKDAGVVNPASGMIEDVYSDGTRKTVRKATREEIAKATHVPSDGTSAAMDEQRRFQREQGLYQDFSAATKKASNAVFTLNDTMREADRALRGDIAAQQRMLYGFINSMDDSAVRDGERESVAQAAPLLAQAQAALSRWSTGDTAYAVPKSVLQQMAGLMGRRLAANKQYLSAQEQQAQTNAKRWGVDPSRFVIVYPQDESGATKDPGGDINLGGGDTALGAFSSLVPKGKKP